MYECAYIPQLQLSRFIAHQLYCRPKARPYYQSQLQNEYQRLFFFLLLPVLTLDSSNYMYSSLSKLRIIMYVVNLGVTIYCRMFFFLTGPVLLFETCGLLG